MARIVVVGAGLGGMSAAYEPAETLGKGHDIVLIGKGEVPASRPPNPWLAVGWRKPDEITLKVGDHVGKARDHVQRRRVERIIDAEGDAVVTGAGERIPYDLPDDLHRAAAGVRGSARHRPGRRLHPVRVHHPACRARLAGLPAVRREPRPDRHRRGCGRQLLRPGVRVRDDLDADLRKRKIRDRVPITFVTSEPYIGHMGLAASAIPRA